MYKDDVNDLEVKSDSFILVIPWVSPYLFDINSFNHGGTSMLRKSEKLDTKLLNNCTYDRDIDYICVYIYI